LGRINGNEVELEPFYVHLTEHESDDYRQNEVLDLIRAGKLEAARDAVDRMTGVTERKIREHNRRSCSRCHGKQTVIQIDGWPRRSRCDSCGAVSFP
jgi:hypothetical protein